MTEAILISELLLLPIGLEQTGIFLIDKSAQKNINNKRGGRAGAAKQGSHKTRRHPAKHEPGTGALVLAPLGALHFSLLATELKY